MDLASVVALMTHINTLPLPTIISGVLLAWLITKASGNTVYVFRKLISKFSTSNISLFHLMSGVDDIIMRTLRSSLSETGAMRIVIVQYHNGEHGVNGLSFSKMTCTHEVIDRRGTITIPPVQQRLVGAPSTMFYDVLELCRENKITIVEDIARRSILGPSATTELMLHGARGIIYGSLLTKDGALAGFVAYEFRDVMNEVPESLIRSISTSVDHINMILTDAGQYQRNMTKSPHG